jgi:hypothetical protein
MQPILELKNLAQVSSNKSLSMVEVTGTDKHTNIENCRIVTKIKTQTVRLNTGQRFYASLIFACYALDINKMKNTSLLPP